MLLLLVTINTFSTIFAVQNNCFAFDFNDGTYSLSIGGTTMSKIRNTGISSLYPA